MAYDSNSEPDPLTPMWWLKKLEKELADRQLELDMMDNYYCGNHPLPFVTKAHSDKMRNEFRQLLDDSKANFMALVVDTTEERCRIDGFRLSASQDKIADQHSWDIWQANGMDQESQTAILEALIKGVSYLSVWKDDGDEYPTIAVEDASQTIIGYEPGSNFKKRASALKIWRDDWTGKRRANVYMPDGIYKFGARSDQVVAGTGYQAAEAARWVEIADSFVKNPVGVVPIVPIRNKPRLLVEGVSELADVYRIQNQINSFLFLLALAGYFGAHKQRWATGIKLMEDDEGNVAEPFDVAIDKMLATEIPDAKFGEFGETDLNNFIKAIEQKVLHIAVTTRTPRHYLIQQGQSPSGDAIESAESGLVQKVKRKQRPFGEGFEAAMRLARQFEGDKDAPVDSETVWGSAETRSIAQVTDAVIKQFGGGLIPWEAAMEELGYTQTQIARYSAMRAGDALLREMLNPTPAQIKPETIRV